MKKIISTQRWLLLFFTGLLLSSCAFRVLLPKPVDPTENTSVPPVNAAGQMVITVKFTGPVKLGSLVVGKTVFLVFPNNPSAPADLNLSTDMKTLIITTRDAASSLLHFAPDSGFTLRLIGTDNGNGVITNTVNTALDGDNDGKPGGDYVKLYHIIG